MLKKCSDKKDVRAIMDYIGARYYQTPYLYVNAVKYGTGADHVSTWIDRDTSGRILGVYLLYYDCLHFFTNDEENSPVEKILDAAALLSPRVIMVLDGIGRRLAPFLENTFELERNHVISMDTVGIEPRAYESEIAKREDIEQIVQLMMGNDEYTSVYDEEILRQQMYDRFDNGFSRFFALRRDGKVVATCSTYGEVPGFALVGGVIVHPDYRHRGFASDVECFACHVLEQEHISRVGFVNFNNSASLALHEKIGARSVSILNKFVRNHAEA